MTMLCVKAAVPIIDVPIAISKLKGVGNAGVAVKVVELQLFVTVIVIVLVKEAEGNPIVSAFMSKP